MVQIKEIETAIRQCKENGNKKIRLVLKHKKLVLCMLEFPIVTESTARPNILKSGKLSAHLKKYMQDELPAADEFIIICMD